MGLFKLYQKGPSGERIESSPYYHYSFSINGEQFKVSTKEKDKKLALHEGERLYQEKKAHLKDGEPLNITIKQLILWMGETYWGIYARNNISVLTKLLKEFGHIRARDLTTQQILIYRNKRMVGIKPVKKSTVNRELALLAAAYNAAIKTDGMLAENPVKAVKPFDEGDLARDRALSADEQKLLLRTARGILRDIIYFALMTGMRVGNILNLKWADVNFTTGKFRFIVRKGKKIKTYYHVMHPELSAWMRIRPSIGENIFCKADGQSYVAPGPTHSPFVRLVEKLGKLYKMPRFVFHDLRHTYITDYLNNGGDIYLCAQNVGHSTVKMTQRYGHISERRRLDDIKNMPGRLWQDYPVFIQQDSSQIENTFKTIDN